MSWRVAPAGRLLYSSFWVGNSKSLTLRRRSSPRVSHRGAAVPHLSRQGLLLSDVPRGATKRDSAAACGRSIFYELFGNTKSRRQPRIREIVPLRAQVRTQHLEDSSASSALAFFTKTAKCALYRRRGPTRIENSFCRPGSQCFVGKAQL